MARRKRYHHGDLPTALLEAARKLVMKKGVESFSLREAARLVGVDAAACYRHFSNREDLLHALARTGFARMADRMEQAVARAKTPEDSIRAIGWAYIKFAETNAAEFRTMFGRTGVSARDPNLRGESKTGRSPFEVLTAAVEHWRPKGSAEEIEELAYLLWGGVHGPAALIATGAWSMPKRRSDEYVEALIDALLEGLG